LTPELLSAGAAVAILAAVASNTVTKIAIGAVVAVAGSPCSSRWHRYVCRASQRQLLLWYGPEHCIDEAKAMATPATNQDIGRSLLPSSSAVIVAAYLDYAELANVSPTVGMKPATGPARSDCD
jgi:hypothetical protein